MADSGSSESDAPKKMSKSQLKKLKKQEYLAKKKAEKAAKLEADKADKAAKEELINAEREKMIEESKKLKLVEDETLPKATLCHTLNMTQYIDGRIRIKGWVSNLRKQKTRYFIDLRDGLGYVQVMMEGDLIKIYDALTLHREAAIEVVGTLVKDERAKWESVELHADYWKLIGKSSKEVDGLLNQESAPDVRMNQRHIGSRGPSTSNILRMRGELQHILREFFYESFFQEITPPTVVQCQAEGGSELFEMKYFHDKAWLTQSSQLYLETVIASLGSVYCIMPSYRAELSKTPRHLAEYTHVEAEMPFITFEDLLNHLEELICVVTEKMLSGRYGKVLQERNPALKVPKRPFKRMTYHQAVDYCREHNIYKDEETKTHFEYGDDIPAGPERTMTDQIGEPIMMIYFPHEMKGFYMSRVDHDGHSGVTESVDLLLPGCGEVVGGSMRMTDYDELLEAYKEAGIDSSLYYWYTDQRRFGTNPHGGYGLGLERFMMWMMDIPHIREACLYPRYMGRAKP